MSVLNAIIFGANGQDGYYLRALCRAEGINPVGVSRSGDWTRGDVSVYAQVEHLIKAYKPQYIFHLAANSTTLHDALFENHHTIALGTLNILEATRTWSPNTRVFIVGSGVQFKNTGAPIAETCAFEPSSAYSLARIHSVQAARYYRSLGLHTYVGYLFHHESPQRKAHHLCQIICRAARRVAGGHNETIVLGDISVKKEYTFAGDVVEAILTLVRQDNAFEAAIGSGVAYSVEDWLEHCFALIGRDWRSHVRVRGEFTPEYRQLVSNPATIRKMGWSPKVELPELAHMMMNTTPLGNP